MKKLNVLIVSTEVNPFAKSGGLGDVVGSLPKELVKKGIDARVVSPKYKFIDPKFDLKYIDTFYATLGARNDAANVYEYDAGYKAYFIGNDYYFNRDGFYGYGDDFERFSFFCDAALGFLNCVDFQPDIIHLNDWQTALAAVYLKDKYARFKFFSGMKVLFTIHNLQYQGTFGGEILGAIGLDGGYFPKFEFYNKLNLMKAGITYADMISSVSETYAREIQSPDFGYGLDGILRSRSADLVGILNGIDAAANDPETDKCIYKNYSAANLNGKFDNKEGLQKELGLPITGAPLIGIVSRLAGQKGFDIMQGMFEGLMSKDVQVVLLGTGEYNFEEYFKHYAWRFPKKLSANIRFNAELAQKIYAGSDMFLMPSLFEPCGLGQMFAMRYGSVPIARKTGGLYDTIAHYHTMERPDGNGFLFEDYIPSGIAWAIDEAIYYYNKKEEWFKIVRNAMTRDFSWSKSANKYIEVYKKLKAR